MFLCILLFTWCIPFFLYAPKEEAELAASVIKVRLLRDEVADLKRQCTRYADQESDLLRREGALEMQEKRYKEEAYTFFQHKEAEKRRNAEQKVGVVTQEIRDLNRTLQTVCVLHDDSKRKLRDTSCALEKAEREKENAAKAVQQRATRN